MNWVVISLAIIILILFYILYSYYTNTATTISQFVNLNASQPAIKTLSNSASSNYAYGIWVYVNNLNSNTNINENTILERNGNIKLTLDVKKPALYCTIQDGTPTGSKTTVTPNFPLQKWVQIIVSVDGQFVDYYLNGKLIKSEKKTTPLKAPIDISKARIRQIVLFILETRIIEMLDFMRLMRMLQKSNIEWSN